ncbi:hypothetical protein BCEP4_70025 [Burkholderia cepacia]|nr:hypothetical protein BCEP4_70025 [Burkholderia cepacia]
MSSLWGFTRKSSIEGYSSLS